MHLVLLLLLLMLLLLILSSYTVDCVGVLGLPPAEDIESLTREYQDSLTLAYGEERLFPALEFPFKGRIIGWKFAATDNTGGARPHLNSWSLMSGNMYDRGPGEDLGECVTSEIRLDSFTVFIHESGPPSPGIEFSRGSILGLFMRPQGRADFVPYLYDGNLQSEVNASAEGSFSYYREVQAPRSNIAAISRLPKQDQLLPLMSLELCESLST